MTTNNASWFLCAAPCDVTVPCGSGWHSLHWREGRLLLPDHPDGEAELVLAALGGEPSGCSKVAGIWQRHAGDLSVLMAGSRGPDDPVPVGWEDVSRASRTQRLFPGGHPLAGEAEQERQRRGELLTLLALGPALGRRLAGQVVATATQAPWPGPAWPALTASTEGRLGPVAERWLGIEPEQVRVELGPPGSDPDPGMSITGNGADRRLQVSLPADWLARVWACGLALVRRHLVLAVLEPGWPDARVLAVPAPGRDPVPLAVHGTAGPEGEAHWEA